MICDVRQKIISSKELRERRRIGCNLDTTAEQAEKVWASVAKGRQ